MAQRKKVTNRTLRMKIKQLHFETGLELSFIIVPVKSAYRIILKSGHLQLFDKPLTTREAAMAIDMLILARQLNWRFPETVPKRWARREFGALIINTWGK